MKKIICLISLLFIWKSGIDSPVHKNVEITKISIINPLSFKVAFQRIHQFEGYYANVKDDKGREIYRGYRDWETDRKSTRLNSSHSAKSRMPSSA